MVSNPTQKTIQTYEKTAKEFFKIHKDISVVKKHMNFFIKNLKGPKILDIGCAFGRDAKYFSKHGLDVTGIDPYPLIY